jgi:hypothetical protein
MAHAAIPLPLTRPAASLRIRELAADSNNVLFTAQAGKVMLSQRITPAQVLGVLGNGEMAEGPACDTKGNWGCTMRRSVAGETVSVGVFICADRLVVVVVFDGGQ